MLKGIIFDFDGTLANTNDLILRTLKETFETLIGEVSQETLLGCIGPTLEESGEVYYPEDPGAFVETYRQLNLVYHDEMIELFPGVREMLDRLQKTDLKLAIVTSKMSNVLVQGLNVLDMAHYFEVLVAQDHVENHKPDPEAIHLALSELGLSADECFMVGDNYHDILAGHNAGMKSVAVGWALKGVDYLKTFKPDYIMEEANDIFEIMDKINGVSDGDEKSSN